MSNDLLIAARKLIAAFDELRSMTTVERVVTGRSTEHIRRNGEEAMRELREAVAKASINE